MEPPVSATSEAERLALIAEMSRTLRDATEGDVWHAVCLIHELARDRLPQEVVRREFGELSLPHV